MGKSGKKVKGDRIEAIRKKFESFLEEDKKRKQRNEYILGKLDKMCTCKAVVPQYKPNFCGDDFGNLPHGRYVPFLNRYSSNLVISSAHADNLNLSNLKDDSQIIHEIVQKFILIPKSQTVSEVNVQQQKQQQAQPKYATDDINWKSKYDILNQLKENETEELTKLITAPNEIPTKDTKEQPKKDINESNCYPATHITQPDVNQLNIQKLPESDDSISVQLSHNIKKCNDIRLEDHGDFMIQGQKENVKYDIDDQLKPAGKIQKIESNLDPKSEHRDTKMKQVTQGHAGDSSNEYLNNNNYHIKSSEYEHNQRAQESFVKDNENAEFLQDNGFSSFERKPLTEGINEFNNPMQQYMENSEQSEGMQYPINGIDPEAFTPNDGVEYPIEVINSEEFIPNDNLVQENGGNINYEGYEESEQSDRMQHPIPDLNSEKFASNEGVVLEDGVNANPEGYEGASSYGIVTLSHQSGDIGDMVDPVLGQAEIEENVSTKGIEEFEAEQRDMWHESPGENVAYSQEGYEQPSQYYYEHVQEYPGDINEHEETQQNYDQSYQQQYVNQYEAEYQQETQQYGQPQAYHEGYEQNYEAQPVYDGYNEEEANHHQQQIHGTPQTIEQELDKEQGFVEKDVEEKEAPVTIAPEMPPNTRVDSTEMK